MPEKQITYTQKFTVYRADGDHLGNVKLGALLRYAQQIATSLPSPSAASAPSTSASPIFTMPAGQRSSQWTAAGCSSTPKSG